MKVDMHNGNYVAMEKNLRLASAIIRFDRVPADVGSVLFERIQVSPDEDLLVYERPFPKNISVKEFYGRFQAACKGTVGRELKRLAARGLKPVPKIDYSSRQLDYLSVTIGRASILKLAKQGRAFRLSFPSQSGGIDWIMTIPREMFALLASCGFSFEI